MFGAVREEEGPTSFVAILMTCTFHVEGVEIWRDAGKKKMKRSENVKSLFKTELDDVACC